MLYIFILTIFCNASVSYNNTSPSFVDKLIMIEPLDPEKVNIGNFEEKIQKFKSKLKKAEIKGLNIEDIKNSLVYIEEHFIKIKLERKEGLFGRRARRIYLGAAIGAGAFPVALVIISGGHPMGIARGAALYMNPYYFVPTALVGGLIGFLSAEQLSIPEQDVIHLNLIISRYNSIVCESAKLRKE